MATKYNHKFEENSDIYEDQETQNSPQSQKFESIDIRNSGIQIEMQDFNNVTENQFQDVSLSGRNQIRYNDEMPHRQIIIPGQLVQYIIELGLDGSRDDHKEHESFKNDKFNGHNNHNNQDFDDIDKNQETYSMHNLSILDHEFGSGNVGQLGTVFNIFKCFVGIGILAMPNAFSDVIFESLNRNSIQFGIVGGSMGILMIGVLNFYTMKLQIYCKEKYGSKYETYSDLGHVIFGPWGKFSVDFSLIISQLGCGVAYLLFIGKQLDQVACQSTGFCDKKQLYISLAGMLLVPVCWLKTFKFVSYISIFASFSIVFAFSATSKTIQIVLIILMLQYPIICRCSLEQQFLILKGYGDKIEDIVTLNLPHNSISNAARAFYCIGLMGSYPIQVIPALEIIEKTKCFIKIPTAPIFPGVNNLKQI
ncbi:UNKNOWN [Stylonychia lemnae]|uniref:Amino acid transporter transmembrane domain-containing protein n=1 Tax=Stylonychia lemnae TaxID=5949 RepID=A0A078A4U5_STYLE|nr:UNKNOWN [Stylonychia lemnae]|eukprot:CDW75794.1 UNKNOWN [Stylonychia lemnae]